MNGAEFANGTFREYGVEGTLVEVGIPMNVDGWLRCTQKTIARRLFDVGCGWWAFGRVGREGGVDWGGFVVWLKKVRRIALQIRRIEHTMGCCYGSNRAKNMVDGGKRWYNAIEQRF